MSNDTLGDRMKGYEAVPKNFLMKRTPVIIRLDGRAFHTFARQMWKKQTSGLFGTNPSTNKPYSDVVDPFSDVMHDCMVQTTLALCKNVGNVVFGYTQSDEISLLLKDWNTLTTQQWFDGGVQKIVSLSAGIATNAFNRAYEKYERIEDVAKMPMFDSRVFNLPKEEVVNYFLWRQQDASRNSVNMLAQYHFSHKALQGKSNSQMQDMLMLDKGVNWNDLNTWKKRGTCFYKREEVIETTDLRLSGVNVQAVRNRWTADEECPIFSQDRGYIEELLK